MLQLFGIFHKFKFKLKNTCAILYTYHMRYILTNESSILAMCDLAFGDPDDMCIWNILN
jgi:hypothetical protein